LHELGHALVSMRAGIPAKAIILLPIGGVTLLDETRQTGVPAAQTWKRDIRIALAGPLVNLVVAVFAGAILLTAIPEAHLWAQPSVPATTLPPGRSWTTLGLRISNLLPAYPMDGGRVLRSIFSRKMDSVTATRRAISIGQAFATMSIFVGMIWNIWFTLVGF